MSSNLLQILTQNEREKIHGTGIRILNEVGVRVLCPSVFNRLLDAGATLGGADVARFPEAFVREHLSKCPKSFTVKDRNNKTTEVKSGGVPLFYTSNATHYMRGRSKKAALIGENEFIEFIRVVDKLENVNGAVGTGIKEYPPHARDFAGFRLMAAHSAKHLRPCIYTSAGAEAILEMADVILDGKNLRENMFFTLGYSIVSPLTWSKTALELFSKTGGLGIPMMINSEPMAGGTSPVTLAGSLALADAEILSGILINQVLEPGRPCIYNAGFAHVLDMMTAIVLTGAPENALLQAAGAEMAEFHGLPSASWALSDAPMLDAQSAYEKMMTMYAHTLKNINMIWGIGNIETSKTISPEAAYIDNELIGNCRRFNKGIKVDEEHLAYNLIKELGFNGKYLETDHTFEYYRKEIRTSHLPNRYARNIWEEKGSKSIEEKAEEKVNEIINSKTEYYLSGAQMEKLLEIEKKRMEKI